MKIHELAPAKGARRSHNRVGRGIGSGWGKTAGKGSKGQSARSGGGKAEGFEGGQMPLSQKMPKRGFKNPFRKTFSVLNLSDLAGFGEGAQVQIQQLVEKRLVEKNARIKILGEGDAPKRLTVQAHAFSKSAAEKIAAAGGKTEVVQ